MDFLYTIYHVRRKDATLPKVHLLLKLVAQAAVLWLFVAVFGPRLGALLFFVYWIVPLFCVFPVLIRIRIATEHYSETLHENQPFLFVSRTSGSNFLEEYLLGAHMEYHMEHHLYPNIPYFQLKRFHRLLRQEGFFEGLASEQENVLSGGYVLFWCRLLSGSPLKKSTDAPPL